MHISLYNPCLLITDKGCKTFGITSLQTDNTLSIVSKDFAQREEVELCKAELYAKDKSILEEGYLLKFNSRKITLVHNTVVLI
jgi:hypothetical protein